MTPTPPTPDRSESRLSRRSVLGAAAVAGAGLGLAGQMTRVPLVSAQMPPAGGPAQLAGLWRLGDDFYFWSNAGYNTIFLVTDDGVIASDPCSLANQNWANLYRDVIRSITDKPVKYVVYSHEHTDHNTGGIVFAETAQFISHRNAAAKLARPMDGRGQPRDNSRVPVPTMLVDDKLTLELGGKKLDILYVGKNHSDNSLVVHYAARRAIFAVDFIPVRGLPFRDFGDSYPDDWVASLEAVEQLDFDVLLPGHGPIGNKANVTELKGYMLDLFAAVRAAQAKGLANNSPEMVADVRAALQPKYGTWGNFETFLPLNIEGILREGFTR